MARSDYLQRKYSYLKGNKTEKFQNFTLNVIYYPIKIQIKR